MTGAKTGAGAARQNGGVRITVETANVDRLDVYLDERPRTSVDVTDGHLEVTVERAASAGTVRVNGFTEGRLVATHAGELPTP